MRWIKGDFPKDDANAHVNTARLPGKTGASRRHDDQRTGVGWLLWVLIASIPWLIPTHSGPWASFYGDWAAACFLLPLLGWAFYRLRGRLEVTRVELLISMVSVVPVMQAFLGVLIFQGEAVVSASFILLTALAFHLGRRTEQMERERLVDSLFASFIIVSLFSMGIALYQWLALDGLGVLAPSKYIGGMRVVANVGQPNNLSTLFVLGCVGCWWGCARRKIDAWVAMLAAAFFILGIVLTGSRTGGAQLVFLAIVLVWWREPRFSARKLGAVFVLSSWFVFLLYAVPALGGFLFGAVGREVLSVGSRPQFWSMAIEGLLDGPWFGYGWNQVVMVHVSAAERYPALKEVMGHAHNFILDLLLWNGILLGGVLVAAIACWGVRQVMSIREESHGIILSAVGVFFIHAMLELPHLYLILLIPVGMLAGAASTYVGSHVVLTMSRYSLVLIAFVLGMGLVATFHDYREIEGNLAARKLFAARISGAEFPEPPRLLVLVALQQALELLDGEPERNMSKERLTAVRRAVLRYPSTSGLFRYAQASALNGNVNEAKWALQLICNLRGARICKAALSDWDIVANSGNPEMHSVALPQVE